MPATSSLARIQQCTTLGLLLAALGWLAWHWERSPLLALSGFAFILLFYALVLGIECVALYFISRRDSTPAPGWGELARAWAGEVASGPAVFCWRQPFRWRAVPDLLDAQDLRGRRGAVFIHGFVCNRGFWTPWLREMTARRHAFCAVNLEPVFGSIDAYIDTIDEAVDKVTRATGLPPVLVCHSMGGLAARAWLRARGADARVAHVITLGTPHRGTWLGRFSQLDNGRQMRLQSSWLEALGDYASPERHAAFTCWYTNCDNIVFPTSTATLPGADNRLVRGVAHVHLAFDANVMAECFNAIAS